MVSFPFSLLLAHMGCMSQEQNSFHTTRMLLYVQGWARDVIPRKEIYLDFGRDYQDKYTLLLDEDAHPKSWVPIL